MADDTQSQPKRPDPAAADPQPAASAVPEADVKKKPAGSEAKPVAKESGKPAAAGSEAAAKKKPAAGSEAKSVAKESAKPAAADAKKKPAAGSEAAAAKESAKPAAAGSDADAQKKPAGSEAKSAAKESAKPAAAKPAAGKPAPAKPAAAAAKPRPKPKPKAPPEPPKAPADQAPPEGAELPPVVAAVQQGVPGAVQQVSFWVGDWTIIVAAERLLDVMRFLKDDAATSFDYCSDVTAADWPPREKRFDVVYCLYSTRLRHRLRVKTRVGEEDPVESVTPLWPAADWLEREVYDQFGIRIVNHPDLRRILMPDQWQGYPQRKDYPLEGPGELLMENPQDWLRVRGIPDEAAAAPAADAEIE